MHRREAIKRLTTALALPTTAASAAVPASATSVRDFGAVGDGIADDTDAIQRAINAAQTVFFPAGAYRVVCRPESPFHYGNAPAARVYRAVRIARSGLALIGDGAVIRVRGHGSGRYAINYAFATDKNMQVGALTDFLARGLAFDFDPTGDPSTNKRSLYLGGVQGIVLEDILVTSMGPRAGGTVTLQQCSQVRIDRFRLKNCTQGMNFSYVTDVAGTDWKFDNFKEAVDFDRVVSNVRLKDLSFLNAGANSQCLDFNSVQDVRVQGIVVSSVGNVALVNYKHTTPPNYGEYVENVTPSSFVPSRNVVLAGIRGQKTGSANLPTFAFGIDRTAQFGASGPCEDITLQDVRLVDCSYTSIKDVKGFRMQDVWLENVASPPVSSAFGAITIAADATYPASEVSGVLRNVSLKNCARIAVRCSAPTNLKLDGVTVDGFNLEGGSGTQFAFDFHALNNRPGVLEINRTLVRNGDNGAVAWRFSENGAGTFTPSVRWGDGNRLDPHSQLTPVLFGQVAAQQRVTKVNRVVFSSGPGAKDVALLQGRERQRVVLCWVSLETERANFGPVPFELRARTAGAEKLLARGAWDLPPGALSQGRGRGELSAPVSLGSGDVAYVRLRPATGQPEGGRMTALVGYMDFDTD